MKKFIFLLLSVSILTCSGINSYADNKYEKGFALDAGTYLSDSNLGMIKLMSIDLSVNLVNSLYAFVGTGFVPDYNIWDFGVYYLFLHSYNYFRPKVILKYGPSSAVSFLKKTSNGTITGNYTQYDEGLAVGAGFEWMPFFNRSLGFDVYITYAFTNSEKPRYLPENMSLFESIDSRYAIYIGLNYYFDL